MNLNHLSQIYIQTHHYEPQIPMNTYTHAIKVQVITVENSTENT